MEFSATLPIDLDALAAAWSRPLEAAAGPDPPIQSESGLAPGEAPLETEFAETLESTLTAGGEVLPLAGSLLPLPIVLEGQASAVAPPAPPGSSAGAARPDARPAVLAAPANAVAAAALRLAAETAVASEVPASVQPGLAATPAIQPPTPATDDADGNDAASRPAPSALPDTPVVRALALPSGTRADAPPASIPSSAGATPESDIEHAARGTLPDRSASADDSSTRPHTPPAFELGDLRSSTAGTEAPRPATAAAGALAPIQDGATQSSVRPGTFVIGDGPPGGGGHGHTADMLGARIQWLADHNVGEARIRLNPPELGLLDIKLKVVDDQTFVHLTAQLPAAREALEGQIPRLREMLALGGLTLGGATVTGGERQAAGGAPAGPVVVAFEPPPVEVEMPAFSPARPSRIDLYA